MIVVSDTSPLNYLILIGQADVLPTLFHRVVAPPSVLQELRQTGAPTAVLKWSLSPPAWLEVVAPTSLLRDTHLGLGELEAIALAQEIRADRLLLDERKASAIAIQLGLSVTGTLGVLSLAAEKNLLDLSAAISALRQTNFREPADIVAALLAEDERRRAENSP